VGLQIDIKSTAPELCKKFGIKRLGLFGSVARGNDSHSSDIDFIVGFYDPSPKSMPERHLGFIEAAEMRYQRPIQLLAPRMIQNPFREKARRRCARLWLQ
jgi:predicted nucleotidyltransferase